MNIKEARSLNASPACLGDKKGIDPLGLEQAGRFWPLPPEGRGFLFLTLR
jgi:hypothetical protein